jgi:hypothetical protein
MSLRVKHNYEAPLQIQHSFKILLCYLLKLAPAGEGLGAMRFSRALLSVAALAFGVAAASGASAQTFNQFNVG